MTTLRDKLDATGLQPHEFRVVRMFLDEEDMYVVIAVVENSGDVYVLAEIPAGTSNTYDALQKVLQEVQALNDHINAHRRVLGLETDVFARNGIE